MATKISRLEQKYSRKLTITVVGVEPGVLARGQHLPVPLVVPVAVQKIIHLSRSYTLRLLGCCYHTHTLVSYHKTRCSTLTVESPFHGTCGELPQKTLSSMNCFFVSANRTIAPSSAISRRCRRNAHNRIVSTQCSGCFTVVREITYVTQHARYVKTDLRNRRPFWDTSFLFLNTPVRPEGLISCVRSTRHARPCRFLSVSSYLLSLGPGVRERERESAQNRTCEWIYCE